MTDVTDTAPVALPPQEPVVANPEPIVNDTPAPAPAPRVAPEAVQAPEPDVQIADVEEPPIVPDEAALEPALEEPVQEAAPEEAATEIVTEADVPSGVVEVSARPAARPNRPTPEPAPEEEPAPQTADVGEQSGVDAAVAAAIASAGGVAESPAVQQGPPLTGSEPDSFRIAVNACWNVDPGSEAARATVVVAFGMTEAGRVDGDVRLVSATGGSDGRIAWPLADSRQVKLMKLRLRLPRLAAQRLRLRPVTAEHATQTPCRPQQENAVKCHSATRNCTPF